MTEDSLAHLQSGTDSGVEKGDSFTGVESDENGARILANAFSNIGSTSSTVGEFARGFTVGGRRRETLADELRFLQGSGARDDINKGAKVRGGEERNNRNDADVCKIVFGCLKIEKLRRV